MAQAENVDVLREETLVDTDIHLTTPNEDLAKYADKPYSDYLLAEGVQLKSPGWDPTLGGKIEQRKLLRPQEIEEELCGELHVDYPIINAFVNLSRLSQSETAVHLQRAANDLLLDQFLDEYDYYGLATVATQKPDKAAEELDRIGNEDSIVGVFLTSTGPNPPLGNPAYDIMYRAAEDNDLPIVYHGATNSGFDIEFPRHNQSFEKFVEAHVNAHLWSQTMTLTSTLANGLPEKFPGLDFVFLEAGISWVPYMMFRLNKEFAMRRSEVTLLTKQPEEYIRESYYFATQPLGEPMDPTHLQQMIDIIGVRSLMFASDYPHWDFEHPSELNKYLHHMFSPEERARVLHGNANEVFDLGI
ncbi:amidohydrolase family protein [Halomarina halobia]|uniref:Amidohydrolase family protein n=1 Tax=Halomarina halobia TaxID=3033386 RepID=A0ABD6AE50_9EURY|nr:amidohydrolase family protein [Halomarina sp. PSR21]